MQYERKVKITLKPPQQTDTLEVASSSLAVPTLKIISYHLSDESSLTGPEGAVLIHLRGDASDCPFAVRVDLNHHFPAVRVQFNHA